MKIFDLISKHRNAFMGIGTILIVFFHAPIPVQIGNSLFHIMKQRCFIGVDMFLFLSGFGLYYSILKNDKKQFYIRRFKRIYPSFCITTLFFCLLFKDTLKVTIIKLSTLGYWVGLPFFAWYISAIIAFYLFFPYYITLFKKKPLLITALFLIGGIIITIPTYLFVHDLRIGFFSRIPIFVLGVYWGYLNNAYSFDINKRKLFLLSFLFIFIGCLCGILLNLYAHQYVDAWNPLPFIFLVPAILVLIILLFESDIMRNLKTINNTILSFIGSLSLEIYLIHETLFKLTGMPNTLVSFSLNFLFVFTTSTILAFLLSKFLKKYVN